jgi:hypothetical protein
VLFDLDGTLVVHDGALRQRLIGWLTDQQLATAEQCLDGLVALWADTAERHFPAFRSGRSPSRNSAGGGCVSSCRALACAPSS